MEDSVQTIEDSAQTILSVSFTSNELGSSFSGGDSDPFSQETISNADVVLPAELNVKFNHSLL
jgi:hypothetical protein